VNFFTGTAEGVSGGSMENVRRGHGIVMVIAWALLAVFGTFIARYGKAGMKAWWFRVHVIVMVIVWCLTIAGFGMIVWFVQQVANTDSTKIHFDGAHQAIGLVITIAMMVQPSLGVIADRLFNPNRKWVPVQDYLHQWLGRLLVLLALIQIGLGFQLYCVTPAVLGLYIAMIFVMLAVFIGTEGMRWLTGWGWWLGGGNLLKVVMGGGPGMLVRMCFGSDFEGSGEGEDDGKDKEKGRWGVKIWLKIGIFVVWGLVWLVVVGLCVALVSELGEMNVPNTNPYYSNCMLIS